MNMFSNNTIVQECLHNAIYNAHCYGIQYSIFKVTFYVFFIILFDNNIHYGFRQGHAVTLDMEEKYLVDCFLTVMIARSSEVTIDGFEMKELDFIINSLACY